MKHALRLIAAALLLAAFQPLPAAAESTLVFEAVAVDGDAARGPAGRIYCGSRSVMTLGGRGWESVADAQEVARRLNALAEEGIGARDIRTERQRTSYIITARGQKVVEIHRGIAKYHRSDPQRLALGWADTLEALFSRPYLSMPSLLVPVGENRARPVKGNIVGDLTARAQGPAVSVSYDRATKTVRVFGRQTGRTELVLSDSRSVLHVPVRAANYAGRVASSLTGAVTGNPASPELVARAAEAAVKAELRLEPGAWASVRPAAQPRSSLSAGQSVSVPLLVSASGEDYLPYQATPQVVVRNQAVPRDPVELLMVSNSPERLRSEGLWFEGTLTDHRSARLLYHHVNSSGLSGDLVVELWNLGDQPARVHVIEGLGGPTRDESWAGHKAASQFLASSARGLGWVLPIPPRAASPVLSQHITPGAIGSGIVEFRPLAPADLRVRLYLHPRRSEPLPYPIQQYSPSPLLGRWLYPNPTRNVQAKYVFGRDWAFITIGDQPAAGLVEGDRLAGSYGVTYDIALDLVNPTAEEVSVSIYLEPAGGPARAFLLIDGRPVEAAAIGRDSEASLARYLLAPGEYRRVNIQTLPQSGSHYPVRIVARPS